MLYIDLQPGQTCHSKDSGSAYSIGVAGLADKMRQAKIPRYSHRLMHRKRVTCELPDSYFRLMTIKHAILKMEWAMELLYNLVKTGSQLVLRPDQLETRCGRESQHSGERERHNTDGHKSGGQYVAVLFGLQLLLTHKPFK